MSIQVAERKCTKCGLVKPFSIAAWHISRGVPCGNLCKKCKAEGLRARRQAAKKVAERAARFRDISKKDLIVIAHKILLVERVANGKFITQGFDEAEVAECLETLSFSETVECLVNDILS